jgi:hypothetical protein
MKHTLSLLIVGTLLFTGCGRKLNPKDTAPAAFGLGREAEPPAAPPATQLVVVDPGNPIGAGNPVAEVAQTAGYTLELRLVDAPVGRPMEVVFEARDDLGKVRGGGKVQGIPTAPGWVFLWHEAETYATNVAGRWHWTAQVDGRKKYAAKVSVLPPTPDEMARFARQEAARENVLRAFSHYWFGQGDHLYTKLVGRSEEVVLQVRDWQPKLTMLAVSEVDRLNGVTYRGRATLDFKHYRIFGKQFNGWTEWSSDIDQMARFVANHSPVPMRPNQFLEILRLRVALLEKDGNWFLQVDGDGEVINGKRISGAPTYTVPPTPEDVEWVLTKGRVPVREGDKARGDLARRELSPLTRPAIDTMGIVRGRTLR